jgi:hypothetical protein
MSFKPETYRVFIASPSDLTDERQVATEVISQWNARNAKAESVVLLPVKGTDALPEAGKRPEEAVLALLDTSDVLIGLFWIRLGTHTGVAESGTVEEIERFITAGKPVMLYFSDRAIPPSRIDRDQQVKLEAFKAKITKDAFVREFTELEGLRTLLTQDLTEQVRRLKAASAIGRTAAPQLNTFTRVLESIKVYNPAEQAVNDAEKRILSVVDWLVPYVASEQTKARTKYFKALWDKVKNTDIEYTRLVQVPKGGADPLRRNPAFVAHLQQCIEEQDNRENIRVFLCDERPQRVGFTIIDQTTVILDLSQLQPIDGVDCAKITEFLMIKDLVGNVIKEFEGTFQLLMDRSRRMEIKDIEGFAGYVRAKASHR